MSTTIITLMQDGKRGESPRKQIRLPIIAPKDDQSSSSSSRSGRLSGPVVPQRTRLPPRSRTGCWTCRTRKVKCDEGRPICGQCGRLGHTCDYSPRLSFRDDTLRVVERMQDVTAAGSTVWDLVTSPATSSAGSVIADDMPPFAALTTDEERERKAEASSPGTYNVVVNPDSFQHLPEYIGDDNDSKRGGLSPLRRGSIAASLASSIGKESSVEGFSILNDPNVVVLSRFEDPLRKIPRDLKSPISPVAPQAQIKIEDQGTLPPRCEEETKLLDHFRKVVWKQIVPIDLQAASSIGIFDEVTRYSLPLSHAMMAVASQSLAQRDGRRTPDGLTHYTEALNLLQKEQDLSSDGVFLTHFLMLVHETALADINHALMRQNHMSMLLKIAILRQRNLERENFPFVVWWICNIDLDSLFTGNGSGEFISYMIQHDAIPQHSYHLYPVNPDGSSTILDEEKDTLPTILSLDYEITVLAARIALLSQEFRHDQAFHDLDSRQRDLAVRVRQSQVFELQESLRSLWAASSVIAVTQKVLPFRSQRLWEHAFMLYRATLIYSYTSMWSAQRMDTGPDYDEEVMLAVSEILHIAHNTVSRGSVECRYLIFPIFMAGCASTDGNQRRIALDLISQMEQETLGRNTIATRRTLEQVYSKQDESFIVTSHDLDVDWRDVMVEQGLTVVNFGL